MDVFLSWSGERSEAVAKIFDEWLRTVVQACRPWISTSIAKGARGDEVLASRLETCSVGIVCLTIDNLNSPWILFEAGALSKKRADAHVCTFLFDVPPEEVMRPLGDFQYTRFERGDIRKLVGSINQAVGKAGGNSLDEDVLSRSFDAHWPDLERRLKEIPPPTGPRAEKRSERDLLVEVLAEVRELRAQAEPPSMLRTDAHGVTYIPGALRTPSRIIATMRYETALSAVESYLTLDAGALEFRRMKGDDAIAMIAKGSKEVSVSFVEVGGDGRSDAALAGLIDRTHRHYGNIAKIVRFIVYGSERAAVTDRGYWEAPMFLSGVPVTSVPGYLEGDMFVPISTSGSIADAAD